MVPGPRLARRPTPSFRSGSAHRAPSLVSQDRYHADQTMPKEAHDEQQDRKAGSVPRGTRRAGRGGLGNRRRRYSEAEHRGGHQFGPDPDPSPATGWRTAGWPTAGRPTTRWPTAGGEGAAPWRPRRP